MNLKNDINRGDADSEKLGDEATDDETEVSDEELITHDTFERLRSRRERRKVLLRVLYIAGGAALCAVMVVIIAVFFLKVADITVSDSKIYDAETVTANCGISLGENLLKVDSAAVEQTLTAHLPYIRSARVELRLPSTVKITVDEDSPKYYTEVYGEYYILSDSLRVVERTDKIDAQVSKYGLKKITCPPLIYAVAGRQLRFRKTANLSYTENVLSELEASGIYDKIVNISIKDKFRMYFVYDSRFKIIIGTNENLGIKLELAQQILSNYTDEITGNKGTIDVQDITKGFVILDNNVDLS